jgi:hypothetical protein
LTGRVADALHGSEEQVRQLFARFLVEEKKYPASLMATEYALTLNKMSKRCDILVFDRNGQPVVLVECKSPDVKIGREVFDQVARYNMVFKVAYLLITNGLKHYCCRVDHQAGSVEFLDDIPVYSAL